MLGERKPSKCISCKILLIRLGYRFGRDNKKMRHFSRNEYKYTLLFNFIFFASLINFDVSNVKNKSQYYDELISFVS